MVDNKEYIVKKSELKGTGNLPDFLETKFGSNLLRWFVSKVTETEIFVEITLTEKSEGISSKKATETVFPSRSVVVSIIPTGVGCEIGGYAADAAPATALLASVTDYLVTNPNAVNASNFIFMTENTLYTEGYLIDQFSKGLINLYLPYSNKVGLIVDKSSKEELEIIFNIVNTVRAVHGVHLEHYFICEEAIGGCCEQNKSGSYVGTIKNPEVLFKACDYLVGKGVNAIAIASKIQDLPRDNYALHFDGRHPNPIGGAEAVISHLVCRNYRIPAAHAPLMNIKELDLKSQVVDARGAGEFSSASGLACVLVGLSQAPQVGDGKCRTKDIVNLNNLLAVVAPAGTLGGIPVLYARKCGIPVIAVKDNRTILDVTRSKLGLSDVYEVNNYVEAAGLLQALKKGISISSVYRPISTIRF